MEDLTFDLEGGRFNCRAAGIIIHGGKVLFHKNPADVYYALIGGRVKIRESSDKSVKREIKEELGKEVEIKEYMASVENFFELDNKKFHEILFVYRAEFKNDEDKKILETLHNVENTKKDKVVQYEWLSLNELDKYDIRPSVIKEVLKNGNYPCHLINNGH